MALTFHLGNQRKEGPQSNNLEQETSYLVSLLR